MFKKNLKVGVIVQARMGSERLPGKILELIKEKPMLWHVVERIKAAKSIDQIVIATTKNPKDNVVEDLAKKEGWAFYRGSEENVLDRYYQAAEKFKIGIIVRVTGDCPLIAPEIIDACVENFKNENCDFISNFKNDASAFPRGLDVRVFSFFALKKANENAKEHYEKEHVTPYIENINNGFKIGNILHPKPEYCADFRLTVDYPEDLDLIRKIYNKFYAQGKIISVTEAISFLRNNPNIALINNKCKQKPLK